MAQEVRQEEKDSEWEDDCSCDNNKNNQCELSNNEPCPSMLSEYKALEECVFSLEIMNDEARCFDVMNQCHSALTRNEKEVPSEKERREHNELVVKFNKKAKEMKHWGKACNELLVKHRKFADVCNEAIKVNDVPED